MINYCCQFLVLVLTPIPHFQQQQRKINSKEKVDQKGNGITLMGAFSLTAQ